jgi:CHASE3 domain sensor protein
MKYILHLLPNRAPNPSHERNQLNKKLRGITYSILAVLVLFNIGISGFLIGALKQSEAATLRIMRAKEIATVSSNLSRRVYDAGVALGGLTMTRSQMFSDRFDKSISAIPQDVTDLKDLIEQKNARQFDALMKVAELFPDTIKHMGEVRTQIMNSKETGVVRGGRGVFGRMHASAAAIQQSLQVIVDENKDLANSKVPTHLINFETINVFLIGAVAGNVILGIALALSIRKTASS